MTQLRLYEPTPALSQWFTPEWAALELVDRFFPELTGADLVVEPSCGPGAFLKALPPTVPAVGVEIDPNVAEWARENTGRPVITGDFRYAELPEGITTAIGNPPFRVKLIRGFLSRLWNIECRRCGFLLPAYAMQTHRTVMGWAERWSMRVELIPRRLFPRLRLPLVFVMFERGRGALVGFCLYRQACELDEMSDRARQELTEGRPRRGAWVSVVEAALESCGGEASLEQLYRFIEPKRPTPNAWWKEQVRAVLQRCFTSLGNGRWRMA